MSFSANFGIFFLGGGEFFGLVFQGFRPPKNYTPKLVGIPLQFHFLKPTKFHADFLLTGKTNNRCRVIGTERWWGGCRQAIGAPDVSFEKTCCPELFEQKTPTGPPCSKHVLEEGRGVQIA